MGTVYVTQESKGKNLEPARKFGDIHVVLKHNETAGPECDYDKVLDRLEKVLNNYNPKEDYILNIGDPVACGIAFAIIMDATKGKMNLLKWIRRTQEYVAAKIAVDW